ncbi:MAG: hypothetical protein IJ086_04495 [Clostridium sp.]|nr:hypothetical protein [Clostridium sp.]
MIDFIIKGNEYVTNSISKEDLLKRFEGKIDLDIFKSLVEEQDELQITYYKNENAYVFYNIDITKNVLKHIEDENLITSLTRFKYMVNVDVDLEKDEITFYDIIDGISSIIDSDLLHEEKIKLIDNYKVLQKTVMDLGFKLDMINDTGYMSLVCSNIKDLTLDKISLVFSKIENHKFNNIVLDLF